MDVLNSSSSCSSSSGGGGGGSDVEYSDGSSVHGDQMEEKGQGRANEDQDERDLEDLDLIALSQLADEADEHIQDIKYSDFQELQESSKLFRLKKDEDDKKIDAPPGVNDAEMERLKLKRIRDMAKKRQKWLKDGKDRVTLRLTERKEIESFLRDKQIGQLALFKQQQDEKTKFIHATNTALSEHNVGMNLMGVMVPGPKVVSHDFDGMLQGKRDAEFGFGPEFAAEAYIEPESDDELFLIGDDGLVKERCKEDEEKKRILDEQEKKRVQEELAREKRIKAEELRLEEEEKQNELKRREEMIFEFYERVDRVAERIGWTLQAFGTNGSSNTTKNASSDAKESLQGGRIRSLKRVNFWTDEQQAVSRLTRMNMDNLIDSIKISECVRTFENVTQWSAHRAKESLVEEQVYSSMMNQVQEAELFGEGSSRRVKVHLLDKKNASHVGTNRFDKRLKDFKEQAANLQTIQAKESKERLQAKVKVMEDSLALLKSQLTLARGKLLGVEKKIEVLDNDPKSAVVRAMVASMEKNLETKTKDLLQTINNIQEKINALSTEKALVDQVIFNLQKLAEQAKIQANITHAQSTAPTFPTQKKAKARKSNVTRDSVPADEDSAASDADSKDSSDWDHDSENEAIDIGEILSQEEHLRVELEEIVAAKAEAQREKQKLEERKEEIKRDCSNHASNTSKREAKLLEQIREAKSKLHTARTGKQLEKDVYEVQAERIKAFAEKQDACRALVNDLQGERKKLRVSLDQLRTEKAQLDAEIERYSRKGPNGTSSTSSLIAPGAAAVSKRKTKKFKGPRGPAGPAGDEYVEKPAPAIPGEETYHKSLQELSLKVQRAYAPVSVDGVNQTKRLRTYAQVFRGEELCEILTRPELQQPEEELEKLRAEVASLHKIYASFSQEVADIETRVVQLRSFVEEKKKRERHELIERTQNAINTRERLVKEIAAAEIQLTRRTAAKETGYEKEFELLAVEAPKVALELDTVQATLKRLLEECEERNRNATIAFNLLNRHTRTNSQLKAKENSLLEYIAEMKSCNPSEQAKRAKRQIAEVELQNTKLARKLRELKSEDARLLRLLNQSQATTQANQADQNTQSKRVKKKRSVLFTVDDEATRQRKAILRKDIRDALEEVARWRQRWQVAKQTAKAAKVQGSNNTAYRTVDATAKNSTTQVTQVKKRLIFSFDVFDNGFLIPQKGVQQEQQQEKWVGEEQHQHQHQQQQQQQQQQHQKQQQQSQRQRSNTQRKMSAKQRNTTYTKLNAPTWREQFEASPPTNPNLNQGPPSPRKMRHHQMHPQESFGHLKRDIKQRESEMKSEKKPAKKESISSQSGLLVHRRNLLKAISAKSQPQSPLHGSLSLTQTTRASKLDTNPLEIGLTQIDAPVQTSPKRKFTIRAEQKLQPSPSHNISEENKRRFSTRFTTAVSKPQTKTSDIIDQDARDDDWSRPIVL